MRGPGTAGCFGKLRCNGDFVTRRLPATFVGPWDAMLQAGLIASREARGPAWLDAYLTAPLLYFALGDAIAGDTGWAGVLMPSVDRAGRHFPLTIAAPVPANAWAGWKPHAGAWFARCGELALSTLAPDACLADFEAGLRGLSRKDAADNGAAPTDAGCRGTSVWWGDGSVRVVAGLPDTAFVRRIIVSGLPASSR